MAEETKQEIAAEETKEEPEEPEHALNEPNLDEGSDSEISDGYSSGDDQEGLNEEDHTFLDQLLDELQEKDSATGVTDTYEVEELEDLNTGWWLSSEQLKSMEIDQDLPFKVPDPTDWKDTEGLVQICIDRARREGWDQCKREVYALRDNVQKIPDIRGAVDEGAKVDSALFDFLLGPKSERARIIMKATGIDELSHSKMMYTFMLSCQTSQSIASMIKNRDINKTYLLPKKEYNRIWRKISKAGEIRAAGAAREDPLWLHCQRIFNEQARLLFMSDDAGFGYQVAIDDDKVHFEWKRYTNTKGMKRCRHTKANARGFVVHTAGFPASGAIIQIGWAQESDTETTVYKRIIGGLFGVVEGNNNRPKINNVEVLSDRGYWGIELFFDCMLPTGAAAGGTLKRNGWLPFTYEKGKHRKPPEGQEKLSITGYKNAYFKTVELKMPSGGTRTLQVVAYRSGTGTSMSLVMTTKSLGKYWDLVTLNPKDHLWYFDEDLTQEERDAKAFMLVEPSEFKANAKAVAAICEHVSPRTCGQNSADWFMDRMFSLTSSQIAGIIRVLAPTVGPTHNLRQDLETVLEYAGLLKLLPDTDNDSASDADGPTLPLPDNSDEAGFNPSVLVEIPPEIESDSKKLAQYLIKLMERWPKECPCVNDFRDTFIHTLTNGDVEALLELIHCKPTRDQAKNKEKLLKWVDSEPSERPFMYMKKTELVATPLYKRLKIASGAKVEDIRTALVKAQAAVLDGDIEMALDDEASFDKVLESILRRSFLKKEAAQDKHDARLIGQMNEPELLRKLYQHSNDLPVPLQAIFHPGLVMQKDRPFLKSSADACLTCAYADEDSSTDEEENEPETVAFMPCELKTIVAMDKLDKFKELLLCNVGFNTHRENRPHFQRIKSAEASAWLVDPNWLLQTLQQAATYKTNNSMFVVGSERQLLLALMIDFPEDLMAALLSVVDFIHNEWLQAFYNPNGLSDEWVQKVEDCLESKALKKVVDSHSFHTNYSVWARLNANVQDDIVFPLPTSSQLIPYTNSKWNKGKHVSDTATKNIDSCDEQLGVRTPQTVNVARTFALSVHTFYRAYQMLSAKEDLEAWYHTVRHCRDAASHRLSFGGAFERCKGFLRAHIQSMSAPAAESEPAAPTRAATPTRRPRRGVKYTIKKLGRAIKNGITPSRKKRTSEMETLESKRNSECLGICLLPQAAVVDDKTGKLNKKGILKRDRCALCAISCEFYCTGCSRFLCVNKDRMDQLVARGHITPQDAKKKTVQIPSYHVATEETKHKWYIRSCYQIAHEKRWQEYWNEINKEEDENLQATFLFGDDNE